MSNSEAYFMWITLNETWISGHSHAAIISTTCISKACVSFRRYSSVTQYTSNMAAFTAVGRMTSVSSHESCGNCPQQNNTYRPRPTVKTHIFGIAFSIQRSLLQLLFPIFPTTIVVTLMYRLQYVPIQSFVCKKVPLTILWASLIEFISLPSPPPTQYRSFWRRNLWRW